MTAARNLTDADVQAIARELRELLRGEGIEPRPAEPPAEHVLATADTHARVARKLSRKLGSKRSAA